MTAPGRGETSFATEGDTLEALEAAIRNGRWADAAHVSLMVGEFVGLRTAEGAQVFATNAVAYATLALVEQQRIANALQVALVDQLSVLAPYLTPVGVQVNPSIRVRDYLDEGQWASIGMGL